ncbi:MAG TPA: alpha/beta hydrolase [Ferruginibacter sp.]|nr:alpha/beta hydrolase [Ferruginibacter sp.]HRO17481.1 alpha/beta hydrolase [Ferruginibacter sp.]HRQ21040.1 alpha/beta hydrolase [Ferruginibacter sp.]
MKNRKTWRIIKGVVLLYAIFGILLHALQEKMLFHPKPLPTGYAFPFQQPFEEIFIPVNTTDTIHMVHFESTAAVQKGDVLYFHGNRNNIEYYYNRVPVFLKAGYDVWMPDYYTFGKSRGTLTEESLTGLSLTVYQYVTGVSHNTQIVVYGRSLGTALASYVAAEMPVKQLILETPYSSIPSLFSTYAFIYPVEVMSTYRLSNYKNLERVQEPVCVFHGTDDGVIPYREAARLKKVLKPGDRFIDIEEAAHNNINRFPLYTETLNRLLQ